MLRDNFAFLVSSVSSSYVLICQSILYTIYHSGSLHHIIVGLFALQCKYPDNYMMERPHIPWYACYIEREGTSPLREKQFWENWIKITDGVTQCHSREYWTLWNKFDLNIFAICPLSNKVKTLSLSVPLKEHFLNNDPAHFFSHTNLQNSRKYQHWEHWWPR